ncbi:MAG TPA: hypothetical protein VMJ34_04485 [Bryobacteraceae bacterium]|nr:hypothetical protein [Bryobacteraceae bacterium]
MTRRPMAVSVIAGFLFGATAIAAVVGFSLLFPGPLLERMWALNPRGEVVFRAMGRISGVFLMELGAGTAVAGVGLLRGRRWGWRIAVALFTLNGCGDVVSLFITHDWIRSGTGVAVAAVFLLALMRPRVRTFFRPPDRPVRQ